MVNTVPDAVTLSELIKPRPWIVKESHLDLNPNGTPTYSGFILHNSKTATAPDTATYFYGTWMGESTGANTSEVKCKLSKAFQPTFNDVVSFPAEYLIWYNQHLQIL